ncbi:MAG: acetyl-CoA C-acetyltransferase [Desulfobacterales bacterium]|jgi:acetyl-CoA C-acetyltransferase|nr:acetyl-CoA C-acetyltransferase [Desulfobacterales bacterium]
MREAWIIDGVRSPRGRGKKGVGSLSDVHPQRIMAQVLNGLKEKVGFDPADVEDVVAGCCGGGGDHAMDIARMSVLDAEWPISVPGITLHRHCGAGQQAVTYAAMGIISGHQELMIGGGVESMSRYCPDHTDGFTANNKHLYELYPMVPQGISADLIATVEGFSREDVDAYAVQSQERTAVSIEEGRFDNSLVPIYHLDGTLALDKDEHPRPGSTVESLGSLNPSFLAMGTNLFIEGQEKTFDQICCEIYPEIKEVNHVHHAGNSSGVVDGASAILLSSPDYAKAHGLKPRARIVMSATSGTEPIIMLTGPGPAAEICLKKAGMTTDDIDLFEVNEAFAAVALKVQKDLNIDNEIYNVNGGAIALGHPIGGTGPMLIQTVLDELERRDKSTALIAMCTGGGMGTATIIERI